MPTHGIGPADASFWVVYIDREAHDRSITSRRYNNRERIERAIERELQALRGDTLTEPPRHVSCNDAHRRRPAQENRRDPGATSIADQHRVLGEHDSREVRCELPTQHT